MRVVKFEMDVSNFQEVKGTSDPCSLFFVLWCVGHFHHSLFICLKIGTLTNEPMRREKNYTRSSLTILSLNIKNCVAACNETSTPTDTLSVIKYHLMTPQQALWQTPKPSLQSQYYHPLKVIDGQSDLQQSAYEVPRSIRPRCVTIAFMLGHHKNRLLCFQ